MKKFSFIMLALLIALGSFAQCTVDTTALRSSPGGFYPDAMHLPHAVRDSAYSQTVQGKIQATLTQSFVVPGLGIPVTVTITVDSVRLDSVQGLPSGITWTKSSNTLPGGGYGCVLFSGTTSAPAGRYNTTAVGMIWANLNVPGFLNKDTFQYGPLSQLPGYNNFYMIVDSLPSPLSATTRANNICGGFTGSGSATVTPHGGSSTDPYTYLWNTGATGYTISNVDTGTYYVTVTSGTDTVTTSVTVMGEPTPMAVTVTQDSGSVHGTGIAGISVAGGIPPYTYRWNTGDTTPVITNLAPGTYRVFITDSFGCRTTDSVVIANLAAGINTVTNNDAQMSLYPNPANSLINVVVESPVAINARMDVIDITGKLVYSAPANIPGAHFVQPIDVKQFSPGIYILQLTSENQSLHQRFVVTR